IRRAAESAETAGHFAEYEIVVPAQVAAARVHTPAFAIRQQVTEPSWIASVDRRRPRERLQHRRVADHADAWPGHRAEAVVRRIFFEESPSAQDREFEAREIRVGAYAILVPLPSHVHEDRQRDAGGIE